MVAGSKHLQSQKHYLLLIISVIKKFFEYGTDGACYRVCCKSADIVKGLRYLQLIKWLNGYHQSNQCD